MILKEMSVQIVRCPLRALECILRAIATTFGAALCHPPMMVVLAFGAYACALYSALKTQIWSPLMYVLIHVLGLIAVGGALSLYKDWYLYSGKFLGNLARRYRALNCTSKAAGSIAVLTGFVYLSNELEKDKKLGFFAIYFFISCYVGLVSTMKLINMDDLFGAADSLMAVSVMFWVRVSGEKLKQLGPKATKYGHFVFFGVIFILVVFKLSKIRFGTDDKEGEEEDHQA